MSPWFVLVLIGYFGICMMLIIIMGKLGNRWLIERDTNADRDALEATGDIAAAESALDKLIADASPFLIQTGTAPSGTRTQATQAARITLRRAALQKTVQMLGLAPTPSAKMTLPELSPFSSSDADRR